MVQIHLIFDRTYYHASQQSIVSCQNAATLNTPYVVIPNATLAKVRDMTRLKEEWKVQPSMALADSRAARTVQESTGLNPPNSKVLPEVNENGMIIFFLHIPKTGGKFVPTVMNFHGWMNVSCFMNSI
jgi:hypothetical protein